MATKQPTMLSIIPDGTSCLSAAALSVDGGIMIQLVRQMTNMPFKKVLMKRNQK